MVETPRDLQQKNTGTNIHDVVPNNGGQPESEQDGEVKAESFIQQTIRIATQNSRSWKWPPACTTERKRKSSEHVMGSSV